MSGYLTAVQARIAAILAGTYPASATLPNRQIPPGTFSPGRYRLPLENPRFPSVQFERRWDLQWQDTEYGGTTPEAENQTQGPHVRRTRALLRIGYAIALPEVSAPQVEQLTMGALEAASRKALEDWALIEWALCYPGNWAGAYSGGGGGTTTADLINVQRSGPARTLKADALRLELQVPLLVECSLPGVTSPGLG